MSQHPIAHMEIPAKDVAAAAKFYADVFGWEYHTDTTSGIDYTMYQAPPGPGGAFVPLSENVQPGMVVVYFGTDDIDASIAKVEANGGKVAIPKMEVPNNGWIAWFTDPTGNTFGLFQGPAGM